MSAAGVGGGAGAVDGMLLSVRDLRVEYPGGVGEAAAVKDISFDIASGGAMAIVGESGSGKSSAAAAIGRLSDLSGAKLSGQILFEGRDVVTMGPEDLRRLRRTGVGYIFQEPMVSLNPVLTVRAQIEEAMDRPDLSRVMACLEEARIPAADAARVARAYPHELSGGLQQRVMIAMALAKNARLLIADEPTTALDATVQKGILKTLAELRRSRGLTLLFITHDLQVARAVADTILVMRRGEIVDRLTRAGNFEPQDPYARKLLAASLLNQTPKTPIGADGRAT